MDLYKDELDKIREEAKFAGEDISRGLTHAIPEVKKEFDSLYEVLKSKRKMDLISEEEYYSSLSSLRDKCFSSSTKEWWKYTSEIYSYEREKIQLIKEDIENTFSSIAKNTISEIEKVERERDRLAQRLNNIGNLFKEDTTIIKGGGRGFVFEGGIYKNETDLIEKSIVLNDFSEDVKMLNSYKDNLNELLNMNIPNEFLDFLQTLSVRDGLEYTTMILQSSEDEFNTIIDNFLKKKNLTGEIADVFYVDDFKKVIEDFKKMTDEEFADLNEKFNIYGQNYINEIGSGFESAVSTVAIKMKEALQNNLFNEIGTLFEEMKISFTTSGGQKTYTANYYINGVMPTPGELNIIKRLEAKSAALAEVF